MSEATGRKGLLLCVCLGTCPSFQNMNIFDVANTLRRDKVTDWVAIHPQLCAEDGDEFLKELLRGADGLERLYVAGCAPTMQKKMFRSAFEAVGFDPDKLASVDIRNMTTEEAVEAIKDLVSGKSTSEAT